MTQLYRHPGIDAVKPADLQALVQSAYRLGIEPDWLAAVISFESSFQPKAQNKYSKATGLIQFMPNTAKALLGTATGDAAIQKLLSMSFQEQLPLVEKYFAPYRSRMTGVEDTYLAVFYPAAIGTNPDHIVGRPGSAVYEQNQVFDPEKKGYITTDDITSTIRKRLTAAKNAGVITIPDGAPPPGSGASGTPPAQASIANAGVPDAATLLAIGGAAWALYQLLKKAG